MYPSTIGMDEVACCAAFAATVKLRDDNGNVRLDEPPRQLGEASVVSLREAPLHHVIPTFNVAEIGHPTKKLAVNV